MEVEAEVEVEKKMPKMASCQFGNWKQVFTQSNNIKNPQQKTVKFPATVKAWEIRSKAACSVDVMILIRTLIRTRIIH